MTEARKWTPGPWVSHGPYPGNHYYRLDVHSVDADGKFGSWICKIAAGEKREANARLIAAAPDLYEALDAITKWGADHIAGKIDFFNPENWLPTHIAKARAALAKARGES